MAVVWKFALEKLVVKFTCGLPVAVSVSELTFCELSKLRVPAEPSNLARAFAALCLVSVIGPVPAASLIVVALISLI